MVNKKQTLKENLIILGMKWDTESKWVHWVFGDNKPTNK